MATILGLSAYYHDSAAALIHDIERDVIVLTEQFRMATYEKGPGYLIEAMAGSLEEGEGWRWCYVDDVAV